VLAELAHYYRLLLPYKAGGMGLVDPHMLRHTAYLGCWTSLPRSTSLQFAPHG
jgi:hypothetical protein